MQTLEPKTTRRVTLLPEEVPTDYYNIQADLPERLPPPLDPQSKQPVNPSLLERIFAKELIRQELSTERYIKIPEEVRNAYIQMGRPTPLVRATRLERFLRTPARIFYKAEYLSPTGSHKPNTALAQAYYNQQQGTKRIVTESGAGQWGSALAFSATMFGLESRVFMVRVSYNQKPGRRTMMETYGAEVFASPSNETKFGQSMLAQDSEHPGTLGIAISEALEDTVSHDDTRYCLGSVLNHVLLHQSVIGLEAKQQFEKIGVRPDVIAGCIGGGSNFAGFAYPFIADKIRGKTNTEFVACEPKAVPSTTRGTYMYDFGDAAGMTPLLKMYTVGHNYLSPPIHSGGLRYHGKAPSLSYLINGGYVRSVAYHQNEVFEAAKTFAQTEGVIPAPETAHCIKYIIDEALRCKTINQAKTLAFNNCGHGLLDLKAYDDFNAGKLQDYEPTKIDAARLID
ncbi:MAG TPA: TrpB-like pyridoxal phosphate-dependent enzyme [Candidatus Bathyarchaeia archaeon]|nr:TrpB-like pyridoxal phosphate-dependent enzyme [Candidatus Bathyarchaeia archaeon]